LTWRDLATVWAGVEYSKTGSDESMAAERETSFRRVAFLIRFRADVEEKMIVVYRGEQYDIEAIGEDGRKGFLILQTERKK
jgi:SPP1 family predicted phage head-tail adaptor